MRIEFAIPFLRIEVRILCGDVPEILPEDEVNWNHAYVCGFQQGVKEGYFADPQTPAVDQCRIHDW